MATKKKTSRKPPSWRVQSRKLGKDCFASIAEMVQGLDDDDDGTKRDAILEDALSVEVTGRGAPGALVATGYEILLSTGGPASRIVGELNDYAEPETARLEVQDWFQPWTEYTEADESVLLAYARCFYFGE